MRELGNRVCIFFTSVLIALVVAGSFSGTAAAFPQDEETAAPPVEEPAAEDAASDEPVDMPVNVDMASMAAPIDPDSFLTAPNDSAEVATAIAEMIRKENAKIQNRIKNSGLGQLYIKGGVFMHPLLLCSIVGLVLSLERLWTLSRARSNTKKLMMDVIKSLRAEGTQAALAVCQQTRGPIAAVLHSGLLRAHRGAEAVEKAIGTSGAIEMAFLERGLTILASVSNVAPLLGFLGTVSGMISAFAAIAAAEQVSAKLVAKGIEEALITTAAGLVIAVPISIFYSYFVVQIDRFVIEMEEASSELVDELLDIEHKQGKIIVDHA
jgi:biopolymer transport protein ExbB